MKVAPIIVPIHILIKNDRPVIELRKCLAIPEVVKSIISSAYHNRGIVIQPKFSDPLKAISMLQEKGVLYYNKEHKRYEFLI